MRNTFDRLIKLLIKPFYQYKKTIMLILIVAAVTLLLSTTVAIMLNKTSNMKVPSLGTIFVIDVEAYWDGNLENKTDTIDWGTIPIGSSRNATLYLQSISNLKTTLQLNTTNWSPQNISEFMNLTWNYDGRQINPLETIQVTLTLSLSSSKSFIYYLIANDVKEFSFDIAIRAIAEK